MPLAKQIPPVKTAGSSLPGDPDPLLLRARCPQLSQILPTKTASHLADSPKDGQILPTEVAGSHLIRWPDPPY